MHVHRSLGPVTFVTCDLALGAEGEAHALGRFLRSHRPDVLVLDRSVEDLDALAKERTRDPFLRGLCKALDPVGAPSPLTPFRRAIRYAQSNRVELRAIGGWEAGWLERRRLQRTVAAATGPGPEAVARSALQSLLDEPTTQELTTQHRERLAQRLENVLAEEPPRLMALFAHPWGEAATATVRQRLGLKRVEGTAMEGGWPA